jgi:hypothetical protein
MMHAQYASWIHCILLRCVVALRCHNANNVKRVNVNDAVVNGFKLVWRPFGNVRQRTVAGTVAVAFIACTLLHCTLLHCTLYTVHCALLHFTLICIPLHYAGTKACSLFYVLCSTFYVLCSMFYVLYSIFYVLSIAFFVYVLCSIIIS